MNKRLERVEQARNGLSFISTNIHDARFDGSQITIDLNDGKVFIIIGFESREMFEKALEHTFNMPRDTDSHE